MGLRYTILAAGKGERLRPVTSDRPKPLVSVAENRSLLEAHLRAASAEGYVEEIVVVTGYRRSQVEAVVAADECGTEARCVFNPCFDIAGPLASVWQGIGFHDDDVALVNGDTLYGRACYDAVEGVDEGVSLLLSERESFREDDMRVRMTEDGGVAAVGKGIEDADAVSAGFVAVRGSGAKRAFDDALKSLLESDEQLRHGCWHSVLERVTSSDVPVDTLWVPEGSWIEVDTVDDLERARRWTTENGITR